MAKRKCTVVNRSYIAIVISIHDSGLSEWLKNYNYPPGDKQIVVINYGMEILILKENLKALR